MNRGEFTRAVLLRLNAPIDGARLTFGVAWAAYESTSALNNPWATTLTTQNCSDYNEDGVKNYPTFEDGVNATVQTLLDTDYAGLVRKLRDPNSTVREIRGALNASPWGSKVSEILFASVAHNYDANNLEVPGSGGDKPVPGSEEKSDSSVEEKSDSSVEEKSDSPAEKEEPKEAEVVDRLEDREKALLSKEVGEAATIEEPKEGTVVKSVDSKSEEAASAVETQETSLVNRLETFLKEGQDFLAELRKEA